MSDTYRIRGDNLGVDGPWIDITVVQVDLDGTVQLEEKDGDRTWTRDSQVLLDWVDGNAAIDHDDLTDPGHDIWDRLGQLSDDIDTGPPDTTASSMQNNVYGIVSMLIEEAQSSNES